MPKKPPQISKGKLSPEMFRVLSSNTKDKASVDFPSLDKSKLKRNLELIWLRIDERFSSF